MFRFDDTQAGMNATGEVQNLMILYILDQIHQRVGWARALIEEISQEENLTFCTKRLTWSILQIGLDVNKELEIVHTLE